MKAPTQEDYETALGDALHEIAGRPIDDAELFLDELRFGPDEALPNAWFWSWALGASTASGRAATPGECHDAACRTLRAALGVPEPGKWHRPLGRLRAAMAFAREAFPNDGAEGETVHLLCDELDAFISEQDVAMGVREPDRPPCPERRWHLRIDVGGDTVEDALSLLDEWVGEARDRLQFSSAAGRVINICTGGPSRGGTFEAHHDPSMTRERYMAAIEAWLTSRDPKPDNGGTP